MDLTGQEINGCQVVKVVEIKKYVKYYLCLCAGCGKEIIKRHDNILKGQVHCNSCSQKLKPRGAAVRFRTQISRPRKLSRPCEICGEPSERDSFYKKYNHLCRKCLMAL